MIFLLAGIKNFVYPELNMCWWLYGLMVLNFVTDYIKGRTAKLKFSLDKLKESFFKTIQYTSFLMLLWCLISIANQEIARMIIIMNGAYMILIVMESKSVAENIRDVSPDSNFSKVVLGPFLSLLDLFIKKKISSNEDKNEKPAA